LSLNYYYYYYYNYYCRCELNFILSNAQLELCCTETAINIGYSCKLLSDEMSSIFVVDADSFDQVEEQLRSANTVMLMNLKNDSVTQRDAPAAAGSEVKKDPTSFAIIINGYSLVRNSAFLQQVCSLGKLHDTTAEYIYWPLTWLTNHCLLVLWYLVGSSDP